jgi:hypothetical protein
MSGTEKALTYAAIQAALAAKSPVRLLILDEMGRFTSENALKCSLAVTKAIESGLIDQAVLIDPERPEIYLPRREGNDFAFQTIYIK